MSREMVRQSSLAKMQTSELYRAVCILLPEMNAKSYKGEHGIVMVIGGSADYSGAPYYAAMGALKCGSDLAYVVTHKDVTTPIRSYSPELIVMPFGDPSNSALFVRDLMQKVQRSKSVVLGPGLGRSAELHDAITKLLQDPDWRNSQRGVVIDADGLRLAHSDSFRRLYFCCLTPNLKEFENLERTVHIPNVQPVVKIRHGQEVLNVKPELQTLINRVVNLVVALDGPCIFLKGPVDIIAKPPSPIGVVDVALVTQTGGLKRCGGQGDILAGVMATLMGWAKRSFTSTSPSQMYEEIDQDVLSESVFVSAFGAGTVVRRAAECAFETHRRGTTSPDILQFVSAALEDIFDHNNDRE